MQVVQIWEQLQYNIVNQMILMKGTLIQFEIRVLNSSVFLKSTVLSLTINHKRFCSKVNNDVRVPLKKKSVQVRSVCLVKPRWLLTSHSQLVQLSMHSRTTQAIPVSSLQQLFRPTVLRAVSHASILQVTIMQRKMSKNIFFLLPQRKIQLILTFCLKLFTFSDFFTCDLLIHQSCLSNQVY